MESERCLNAGRRHNTAKIPTPRMQATRSSSRLIRGVASWAPPVIIATITLERLIEVEEEINNRPRNIMAEHGDDVEKLLQGLRQRQKGNPRLIVGMPPSACVREEPRNAPRGGNRA